jgi:hypothetical protein
MNRFIRRIFWAMLLTLPTAASGEAAVRVSAKVETETAIYSGDQFIYSVVVEGGSKPSSVDIGPLAAFSPRPTGSNNLVQTINGRTTISYSQNFVITAGQVGKMTLSGVKVTVDGKEYTTNPVEVTVSGPGTTDRMTMEFSVSRQKCYVGEPIVMNARWIVTARWQNVGFDVPVFTSPDFLVEDVSSSAGPDPRQSIIDGVPTSVTGTRQTIQGVEAEVYAFSKVLIPQRAGRLRLDPITVSTNMATGRVRTGDFFNPWEIKYERVSVQSEPVELEVLPLPETGKPSEFYGLVGQYTISASAAPTKVSVGDPITLTISIGGNPYLKPVQWPALEQVPELAANFRIPTDKASPTIENGCKVFTQTVRANNDQVTQIPAIPLAYFDLQRGRYVEARTEPIKLDVTAAKILTNADVQGTGSAPVNREVEAVRKGLSANYYGPEVLVNQGFSPLALVFSPGYAAVWAIPLTILIVSAVVRIAGRTSPESLARKRRRQAAGAAMRQLRKVASAEPGQRHELLAAALKGYLGDRFDRVAASLTADDCFRIVAEATGDTQTATLCREMVAACEAARYAPLEAAIETEQVQEAERLIHTVEKRSKK